MRHDQVTEGGDSLKGPCPLTANLNPQEVQLDTLVEGYLRYLNEVREIRRQTDRTYESTLRAFARWADGRSIHELSTDDLVAFTRRLRYKRGSVPSASTRKREHSTLSGFYVWLQRAGITDSDPFYFFPKLETPRYDPKPISDEVWKPLWKAATSLDDRLWLGLGYWCGLRRFEMATITPEAVNGETCEMRFERKGAHVVNLEYGELIATLQARLPQCAEGADLWLEIIEIQARHRRGLPFLVSSSVGSLDRDCNWFNHRIKFLLVAAGLDPDAATPHRLRHSCATNLLRSGVPIELVADQLNHSNIQTTRRYLKTSGQLGLWRKDQN